MNKQARLFLYMQAIEKWGPIAQMEMAQEEATELALAVRKQIRNNDAGSFYGLCSEVADMEIMIEQMEFMMKNEDFRNVVENIKKDKLERLNNRLENNQFNG